MSTDARNATCGEGEAAPAAYHGMICIMADQVRAMKRMTEKMLWRAGKPG